MTINYKGYSNDYKYRVAEIGFDDETEETLMNRLAGFLEKVHGYTVDIIGGLALIEVDSREDYEELVKVYKAGKKMLKNCAKHGF